jgi:hypothetical protein
MKLLPNRKKKEKEMLKGRCKTKLRPSMWRIAHVIMSAAKNAPLKREKKKEPTHKAKSQQNKKIERRYHRKSRGRVPLQNSSSNNTMPRRRGINC